MSELKAPFTRDALFYALYYALDAYDLTIRPRAKDEDEPDTEDITALSDRIFNTLYPETEETE